LYLVLSDLRSSAESIDLQDDWKARDIFIDTFKLIDIIAPGDVRSTVEAIHASEEQSDGSPRP
jgi:hypothetical protein